MKEKINACQTLVVLAPHLGVFSTRRPRGVPNPRAMRGNGAQFGSLFHAACQIHVPCVEMVPKSRHALRVPTRRPRGVPNPRAMRGNDAQISACTSCTHAAIPKGTHAARPVIRPTRVLSPIPVPNPSSTRVFPPTTRR